MTIVIAASRPGYENFAEELSEMTGRDFVLIQSKADLSLERLSELNPEYVFFPHWSYIIPAEIHERFDCVIFHMTDVPFGRGGSPLQNLIARGVYETKMTALKCVRELDAGPVYMKKSLSLEGTAEEIYGRGALLAKQMMVEILTQKPEPLPQTGEPVTFPRRKPHESDVKQLSSLESVFDYIRMLDAEGYPRAFVETPHLRFEFEAGAKNDDHVFAHVKIYEKKK